MGVIIRNNTDEEIVEMKELNCDLIGASILWSNTLVSDRNALQRRVTQRTWMLTLTRNVIAR